MRKTRREGSQFNTRMGRDRKASGDDALTRQDSILLTDRDFLLFEELMTRAVEPNTLVRTETVEFNNGHFDGQGRYHW